MVNSKTIFYGDDGSINFTEIEVSDPGPGEIQLTGGACGICSWDVNTCKLGKKMVPMAPPGHEGMGYVTKIGPGVTEFQEGDRVAGGGFATIRNISIERAYKLPESNLSDEYWIVEPISCAVTGLDRSELRPGHRVAVIGSGFMGLLLIQGLLQSPIDDLVVIDISPNRLALAQQLGVVEVYNPLDIEAAELAQMLKPRAFDVVIDSSGSQAGLDLATDIVKRGGLINLFGWIKGQSAYFDPTKWHLGGFTVVNSAPGSKIRNPFPPAIQLIHKGVFNLEPLVTHVTPLAGYADLMEQILDGDQGYVKGVITLS